MPPSRTQSPNPTMDILSSVRRIDTSLKTQNHSRYAVQHELANLREATTRMQQLLYKSVKYMMERNTFASNLEEVKIDIDDTTAKIRELQEKEKAAKNEGTPEAMSEFNTKYGETLEEHIASLKKFRRQRRVVLKELKKLDAKAEKVVESCQKVLGDEEATRTARHIF
ncbi:hypothetical protein A1Q2_06897 [Trichosporon asahii var. asahii CBS 8904]|uniref:Uncharacterized protein n=2 Tax=Trichosporon asahii var. asahii TaxID=189963 RepID=K1V483_TRIAC|nr:hypothetical protein A1Q1_00665 [Trichosporon asahii var. asahii CBS 2479]EJT52918.1 hypothetical protein A1Q1_00665 [Trichosporon asahii var. asahii CBS 2479]EKC98794.1 hypothetical protein A1Q2_06897 [Trichosporon asahii var. asahii CBS 8904]